MATTDTAIIELPLEQLHDSPTNPRQHYPEAYLQELANNIRHVGRVLQPLLVRPRVPALFASSDDPNAIAGHEIVFGHCRKRGAELAAEGLAPLLPAAQAAGGAKPAGKQAGAKKAAPTPSTAARAAKGAAPGQPRPGKTAPAAAAQEARAADLFGRKEQTDEAGSAGQEQTDDAGPAGGQTTTAEAVL